MASQEVTLRTGDTINLLIEHAGKTFRLNLNLTEQGVAFSAPANSRVESHTHSAAPQHSSGQESAPESEYVEDPVFADEPVQAVDLPTDDMVEETNSPVEVSEEHSGEIHDDEFALEDEAADSQAPPQEEAVQEPAQRDSTLDFFTTEPMGSADNLSLTNVPGVRRSEHQDLALDEPGFSEQGLTMVPPSRHHSEPEPEPELLATEDDNAQPLDALSSSLSPVKFHDPATDNMEQPEMQEKRPAPQGIQAPRKAPAAAAPKAEELPPWTGRARDYRDPKLEAKRAATSKINKDELSARSAAQPAPQQNFDETIDLSLSLEEEQPVAPAPVSKKPTAPLQKPAPAMQKAAPPAPKPAPVAAKPAPVAAKPAAASAKAPAVAAKVPEGNFTVFLSPPKGSDKKQAAAQIISEVQGIDMNAANALAGKMIVPVVKGVTEEEANRVRDLLKEAGLSSRITQKR